MLNKFTLVGHRFPDIALDYSLQLTVSSETSSANDDIFFIVHRNEWGIVLDIQPT